MISAFKVVIDSIGGLIVFYFSTVLTISCLLFSASAVLATFRQSRLSGKISSYGMKIIILSIKGPVEMFFHVLKFAKPSLIVAKEEITKQSKQYYQDYKENEKSKRAASKAQSAEEVLNISSQYATTDRKVVSLEVAKQNRKSKSSANKGENQAKSATIE